MQEHPERTARLDKPDIPTTIECMMNMSETVIMFNGQEYVKERPYTQMTISPLAKNN